MVRATPRSAPISVRPVCASRPVASYVASQGRELGRDGRVSVIVQGGEVEIGGRCVTVIEGVANL